MVLKIVVSIQLFILTLKELDHIGNFVSHEDTKTRKQNEVDSAVGRKQDNNYLTLEPLLQRLRFSFPVLNTLSRHPKSGLKHTTEGSEFRVKRNRA